METQIQTQMTGATTNTISKVIKRYQNRKLYDTQQSCYVTLDDIAKMIRNNEEVTVIDNKSKRDITASTLTQIIFEAEKKVANYAPLTVLREIIQHSTGSMSAYLAKLNVFSAESQEPRVKEYVRDLLETSIPRSFDDVKSTLDNRIAQQSNDSMPTSMPRKDMDEVTPELPNSNKSLGN